MAEWGPWIEHDGKGCPVCAGTHLILRCEFYPGQIRVIGPVVLPATDGSSWIWSQWMVRQPHGFKAARILAYRLPKGRDQSVRMLRQIIEHPYVTLTARRPSRVMP